MREPHEHSGGLETFTAFDLQRTEFPPLQWVVPGYVTEGLTVVAGKPKIGKSWMVLDWALAVAYGGSAFGAIRVEDGDVLYCALEDNPRRLKRRINQVLRGDDAPDRLQMVTKLPRIGEGCVEALRKWARGVEKPRLIIIDTWKQVKKMRKREEASYDADYDSVEPLQALAGELGIAIVVVHHANKSEQREDPLDMVSGTTGVTGAGDTVMVLYRDTQGTTLYGRGRDIEDDIEVGLEFDRTAALWRVLGPANEAHMSDQRKAIFIALRDAKGPLSPKEVALITTVNHGVAKKLLVKMFANGDIQKPSEGKYASL